MVNCLIENKNYILFSSILFFMPIGIIALVLPTVENFPCNVISSPINASTYLVFAGATQIFFAFCLVSVMVHIKQVNYYNILVLPFLFLPVFDIAWFITGAVLLFHTNINYILLNISFCWYFIFVWCVTPIQITICMFLSYYMITSYRSNYDIMH
jgi:hypothetical protein